MADRKDDLAEAVDQQSLEPSHAPPTIHYTELPEATLDTPLYREWNVYRQQAGRLLTEGLEGKWVLIQGKAVIGIWDTQGQVETVRRERFPLQPVLVKEILEREPIIRCTRLFHPGFLNPCRS